MNVLYEGLCIGGPGDGFRETSQADKLFLINREGGKVRYDFHNVIADGQRLSFWLADGIPSAQAMKMLMARYAEPRIRDHHDFRKALQAKQSRIDELEKAADEAAALAERQRARINELLEAGNRYQQEARDARAKVAGLEASRENLLASNDALEKEIHDMRKERGPWQASTPPFSAGKQIHLNEVTHFYDAAFDRVSKQAINAYDRAKTAKSDGGIKSAGSLKATATEDAPFDPSLYERVQRLEKWVTRLLDRAALGK